jgi:hypothetical protein
MDFSQFLRAYGKGAALLFGSAAVSYFLTFHSTLSPPLKPREAIYAMSVLVEAYAILVGLNAGRSRKPPLNLMIGSVVIYLLSLFSLTFLIPTSDRYYREAIGFICKMEFLDLYGPSCYWISPKTLANESFEPARIWEYWSVQIVRLYLSTVWLVMVWSVVLSIALSLRQTTFKPKPRRAGKD